MSKWHTTEFCENCYKEFCCTRECKNHLLHRIKQAREEIAELPITDTAIRLVTEILDKLIESEAE